MAVPQKDYMNNSPLVKYCKEHSTSLHPAQERLIQDTMKHERFEMLGSADELQMLQTIVSVMNAKKTLDIGVYTGYSALTIALGLPDDGRVVACDVDEFAKFGMPYWKEAGVDHKIDLRIAPATETLESLIANGESETYDFAFIDADKPNYPRYYELCMKLIRPNGIIAVDNALAYGRVLDGNDTTERTLAIRKINDMAVADERVTVVLLQIGDGTSIIRKK